MALVDARNAATISTGKAIATANANGNEWYRSANSPNRE